MVVIKLVPVRMEEKPKMNIPRVTKIIPEELLSELYGV